MERALWSEGVDDSVCSGAAPSPWGLSLGISQAAGVDATRLDSDGACSGVDGSHSAGAGLNSSEYHHDLASSRGVPGRRRLRPFGVGGVSVWRPQTPDSRLTPEHPDNKDSDRRRPDTGRCSAGRGTAAGRGPAARYSARRCARRARRRPWTATPHPIPQAEHLPSQSLWEFSVESWWCVCRRRLG
jgi:hypothetical protein